MKVNLFKKWSHKGRTIWYPEAGGMEVKKKKKKKKKKNFAKKKRRKRKSFRPKNSVAKW